jgi:hypothetical protein
MRMQAVSSRKKPAFLLCSFEASGEDGKAGAAAA